MEELRPYAIALDYSEDKDALRRFLFTFEEKGSLKYQAQIKQLGTAKQINIDLVDIIVDGNTELYGRVLRNTERYREMVYELIDEMLTAGEVEMPAGNPFFEHRKTRIAERYPGRSIFDMLPKGLLRFYSVNIYNRECTKFDEVSPERIGSLVTVQGIVAKASEIHPAIAVAVYMCDSCTSEVFQEVPTETFMPAIECRSEKCRAGRQKGTLLLQTRASRFRAKQVLHLQELPQEVQPGRIPRTLSVEVYDELAGLVVPGEEVRISGSYLPKPNEGIQKYRMGLLSDTYILGSHIQSTKKHTRSVKADGEQIVKHPVEILARSIAPEIAGLDDVKKMLLLLLIGGDTYTEGGMRIRGEINILLVGDPGVAKSQLLKAVKALSPRGVFTTGRGASSAGLTACVTKDPDTGETVLEGGALVMSDGGVCCIDEFDKMHEHDRSCVHEAMEQHRISISKAGINTTLNARCSVLAAANPIKGRYVPGKSVAWNAGLPSALISRFDAVCVLQDVAGKQDAEIARHILEVHRTKGSAGACLSPEQLAACIGRSREITVALGQGVRERIVEAYVQERSRALGRPDANKAPPSTARKVLSVLRFAQALAKAEQRTVVTIQDVEEVLRLLGAQVFGVQECIEDLPGEDHEEYKALEIEAIYRQVERFSRAEIDQCIRERLEAGVWALDGKRLILFRM